MKSKIKSIELKRFETYTLDGKDSTRISVYFDNKKDSHHIQFQDDINRRDIAALLHELAELILKGGCETYAVKDVQFPESIDYEALEKLSDK